MKISQPINFIDKFKHDKGMFIFTVIMTIIYAFVEVLKFQLIWLFLRLSVLVLMGPLHNSIVIDKIKPWQGRKVTILKIQTEVTCLIG